MAPSWGQPIGSLVNAAASSRDRVVRAFGDALFAAVMVVGRAISPRG
jgi:hypothetical protein